MKKVVLVVLVLAMVAASAVAFAQQNQQRPQSGTRGGMMMAVPCPSMAITLPPIAQIERSNNLGLTDDQKTQLKAILAKANTTLASLRQHSSETTKALRDAIYATNFDATKVQQLLLDAQKADAAISSAEVAAWTEIRAILTADQVSTLQSRRSSGFGGPPSGPMPLRSQPNNADSSNNEPAPPPAVN